MSFEFLLDFLFPRICVACRARIEKRDVLCAPCAAGIRIEPQLVCGSCGTRLPEMRKVCHKDSPYLLAAAQRYEHPTLRALIHALKFKRVEECAPILASFMKSAVPQELFREPAIIVPVPLGRKRLLKRGYNQAELLSRELGILTGLPSIPLLSRTRDTEPQSSLRDFGRRETNVENCFAATEPSPSATVFLVDDVTTSGATFREASKALRKAGARKIYAVVAARAF